MTHRKRGKRRVNPVVPPTPTPSQPRPDATAHLDAQGPAHAGLSEPQPQPPPETEPEPETKFQFEPDTTPRLSAQDPAHAQPQPEPEPSEFELRAHPEPAPALPPSLQPGNAAGSSATHKATPLKPSSSHTSTTEPREQRDLELIIKAELGGATYKENDFIAKWFPKMKLPYQNALVNDVLSKLAKANEPDKPGVSHKNLCFQHHPFDASKPFHSWPLGKSEGLYYTPFVWLLNSILALANEHRVERSNGKKATQGESLHHNLRFHVYGLEMKEVLDGVRPLKPDGIGTHGPIETGAKVSWRDVEIAIEIKELWGNLIAQGATYARSLFAARETRHFALLIAYNHQSSQARFCFFRRDGLRASKALNIREEDGFKTFVRAVAGLLSWSTLFEAGMDPSRSERQFFIADRCLDITEVLCNRRSVRGRATRVYKVRTAHKPTASNVEGQATTSDTPSPPVKQPTQTTSDATSPPVEKPTHQYLLRSRRWTEPTSARWSTLHAPDSASSQQPAVIQPMPSLLAQMHRLNVVGTPDSAEPDSSGDPAPIPPGETSMEGGIPKWYIQSRSEDWARSGLGEVSPSGIDDPLINRSRDPLVETWKLGRDQLLQLQKCESVIIKESWLTQSHRNEGAMFKCVNNCFGVPRLLCDRHFTKVDNHQASFWPVWSTPLNPTIPEQRCLSRTIYLTEGYDICTLESPRKLVEVLLHAMLGPSCDSCSSNCCSRIFKRLGHWVLFKAGWLHRDVSVSNIMAIAEEARPPVTEYVVLE